MAKNEDIKSCDFCKYEGNLDEGDVVEMIYKDVEGDCSIYTCVPCMERLIVNNLTKKASKRISWGER